MVFSESSYREKDGDIVPVDDYPDDAKVSYQHPDTTEYNLVSDAAARAERILNEPVAVETAPVEIDKATSPERVMTVLERFGFAPHDQREMSDTYDLTGKELVGGSASHLNAVFNRQKKYMEDPDRTVRSIVSRYAEYATQASREAAFLTTLQGALKDDSYHQFARADSVTLVSIWKEEPSVARPLLEVLWTHDVEAFANETQTKNPLQGEGRSNYNLSDKTTKARLETMINGMRINELSREVAKSQAIESERYKFWIETLKQARNHTLARGIAYKALVDLREIEQ